MSISVNNIIDRHWFSLKYIVVSPEPIDDFYS